MKNNKKRIYRPRDYMKALVISLLVGILCIAITQPILIGAARYFGIQRSINMVALEAKKKVWTDESEWTFEYVWTDELTARSKEYEAKREEMANENVVIDWCYKNYDNKLGAFMRNSFIGVCIAIFLSGTALTLFMAYCIGRDIRQCGIPYIVRQWKRGVAFIKEKVKNISTFMRSKRENAGLSKAEKTRIKVYKQFGIEAK